MPTTTKRKPATALRRRAEVRLKQQAGKEKPAGAGGTTSVADTRRLLHELQVHQIELELQNEELRHARDEIEAGLERYSDLYDFAPVGYLTLDRDGAIRESNLMGASLLGLPRAGLVKQHLRAFLPQADGLMFDAFLRQVFARGEQKEFEGQLLVKDQPPTVVRMRANLFASGQTCRLTVSDIMQQLQAEEDRLVVEKLKSTGILAGGIAHDFNNLLTVVSLNLDLVQRHPELSEIQQHLLANAKQAVVLAHDLTQQLIIFASGGSPVRTPTRLPGVVKEAVRLALGASGSPCDFSAPDDLWLVGVDHGQIGQVVRNLILNAREAMPAGGAITVRLENVVVEPPQIPALPPGRYLRVSVADQGGGILPTVLPKIFDPYFSTKQRGTQKGMGLGLTICRAIIQKHGGAISVESKEGAGATFHFYLPTIEPAPDGRVPPGTEIHPRRAGSLTHNHVSP